MKYLYTTLFSIKGLKLIADDDIVLVVDPETKLRAVLTFQPNPYMFETDRSKAVATVMLNILFNTELANNDFKQQVIETTEVVRAMRQKGFGSNLFLVATMEGEAPSFDSTRMKDAGDFSVCFDGIDKDALVAQSTGKLTALLNSIILELGCVDTF